MKTEVVKLSRSMDAAAAAIQNNLLPMARGKEEVAALMEICAVLGAASKEIYQRSSRLTTVLDEPEITPR